MFSWAKLSKIVDISKYFSFFYQKLLLFQKNVVPLHPLWSRNLLRCHAQMAESVDALVSNTSGATRAGSTPALGTKTGRLNACLFLYPPPGLGPVPFFSSPQRTGGPPGPLSLAYSLRPNTFSRYSIQAQPNLRAISSRRLWSRTGITTGIVSRWLSLLAISAISRS